MSAEIQVFLLNRLLDSYPINDVLLGPVFDSNESESELYVFSFNHSLCVCSLVHDIYFSDNSDCPNALWI